MHVTRLRYLIRRVLGVALLGTLCSHSVVAQSETKVHLKTINALISTWASLELFLLDAPSLSDSQRGTVEVFEEALRKELFATAAPIRDANAGCANRWPFPHDAVDSAIDRMSQVREIRSGALLHDTRPAAGVRQESRTTGRSPGGTREFWQ